MMKAGERSRELTQSLLAFSRHRAAQPQVLSLSKAVAEMEPMLRRLLGEDIELVTHLLQAGGKVQADPGQIDQVIMNLVVNARDAMPQGGRLAIEVAHEELTSGYAEKHLGVRSGSYIRMAVTDTGDGIPKEVMPHLFEPFFTTKPSGKGTGLGLSTVYGIVRNSGGHIRVYSEPGHGTTFKVYLPEADATETGAPAPRVASATDGSETILLVEDDDSVRELVRLVLDESGYRVLTARSAADALAQCSAHRDSIDLLLTDMVMPQGGGRELAERVHKLLPAVRVIFMSGYTEDTALEAGALPPGALFIQKPVLPDVLKALVRQALDG
jgi:CheY-like chemotaxis protein